MLVEELEATAPFVDQRYPDEVALAVRAALTDAELFVSYNMPAKALGPLLSALPKAPHDLRLNQRLAALHTRAGRFSEAAVCCRNLEQLYHDAGHPDEATRYKELADKYEERTSNKATEISAPFEPATSLEAGGDSGIAALHAGTANNSADQFAAEPAEKTAAPAAGLSASGLFFHKAPAAEAPDSSEFQVHAQPTADANEIDISAEWEGEVSDESTAPAPAQESAAPGEADFEVAQAHAEAIAETIDEVRFYLKHSMAEQARAVFVKLEKLKPGAAQLAAVWQEIDDADQGVKAKQDQPVEEISVEAAEEVPAVEESATPSVARSKPDQEFVSDLHPAAASASDEDYLPKMPIRTTIPVPEPAVAEYAQASPVAESAGVLGEFVSDLEASLGDSFLPPAAQPQAPEPQTRTVSQPTAAASGNAGAAAAPAPAREAQAKDAPAKEVIAAAAAPTFTYQPTKKRTLAPEVAACRAKGRCRQRGFGGHVRRAEAGTGR